MNFKLTDQFIDQYRHKKPPFGFNGLGELVFYRTYSRIKPDGTNESWYETVRRVVEGTFSMQKRWIDEHGLGWNPWKAQKSAQEMYDRIFNMKFLPPGRGLWAMGTPLTEEKELYAALNNCSFVSTENIRQDLEKPFVFLMDMSMLGVGVGFDTKGAGQIEVKSPGKKVAEHFVIPDSREGWVESVRLLLRSYLDGGDLYVFDYSQIRKAGEPIRGFGGISAGPEPLIELHRNIKSVLDPLVGQCLTVRAIVDIMNFIGKAVVSGNVRRSAEIAFGDPDNEEFLDLKNYELHPERAEYGWASNNTIFARIGMDYDQIARRIEVNGEPGLIWMDNVRAYSRMGDDPDYKDAKAQGANPCSEQTLESYELCCLVETFPANHDSLEDYLRTLKFAYLYAKTVTLGKTHWSETNRVMLRNRRIGCSMSGIAQFIGQKGIEVLREWTEAGYKTINYYDKVYSDWLVIPRSIKTTSVKPSGTVSLLAGATPGVHYPENKHYIRRVRISKHSNLIEPLREAGYDIEPAFGAEDTTLVVSIPIEINGKTRTVDDVSIWEQAMVAAFMQEHWSDNQVSCTISFDPETEADQIVPVLNYFQYKLKSISFLPRVKKGAYKQMPYETITEEEYNKMVMKLHPIDFSSVSGEEVQAERFCDSDVCRVDFVAPTLDISLKV